MLLTRASKWILEKVGPIKIKMTISRAISGCHTTENPVRNKTYWPICSNYANTFFLTAPCRGRSLEMAQILSSCGCVCLCVCNNSEGLRVLLVQGRAMAETKEDLCPNISRRGETVSQHGDGHGRHHQCLFREKSDRNGLKIGSIT